MARRNIEFAPNLTDEDRAILAAMDEFEARTKDAPPAPQNLIDKMQGQAEANDALSRPGPARDVFERVMNMPEDEFEAEFADVLNANAYDEEDAEEEAMGPWTPPSPERLARRTREFYDARARRDAERWEG